MVTTYDKTPVFRDRLAGATLVVLGRVEDVLETVVDRTGDEPQVQTIVRVEAEEVLLGETEDDDLRVRVVGGETDEARTQRTVSAKEGQTLFLLLARDHVPGQEEAQYVPYFSSGYPVDEEGNVELDEETAAQFEEQNVEIRNRRVDLDILYEVVERFREERREERLKPPSAEEREAKQASVGEVSEMPVTEDAGPTSASPRGEPDER